MPIEKQIAGKCHLITQQEGSEYVEHEILHERFHVTHFAGCAFLVHKDTFYPTSASNPSTFTTRSEVCKIILLRKNKDGFCKAFFHVPLSVELQPVVRRSSPYYPCISAIFMPRKKELQRKSSRPFVLL